MAAPSSHTTRRADADSRDSNESSARMPAPDDHLLRGEQPYELIGGRLRKVAHAEESHARQHVHLGALLEASVLDEVLVAGDLLTRVDDESDFASDVCVYPTARDPETGGRQLEEIAFEIRAEQSMADVTDKARRITARGVRRVFCVDLKKSRVLEWSSDDTQWQELPADGEVADDACLACPLDVETLLDATRSDNAIVKALRARQSEALEPVRREGYERGHRDGVERSTVGFLEARLSRRLSGDERALVRSAVLEDGEKVLTSLCDASPEELAAWFESQRDG